MVIKANFGQRVVGIVVDGVSDAVADRREIRPAPEFGDAGDRIPSPVSARWASAYSDPGGYRKLLSSEEMSLVDSVAKKRLIHDARGQGAAPFIHHFS